MKSVNSDEIKRKVLLGLPGPFLSSKRVYNSFSSSQRPTPTQTEVAMRELEQDGFGSVQHMGRSMVFYKALPSDVSPATLLNQFGTNMETFTDNFFARDLLMSSSQFDNILLHHPQYMEVQNAMLEYELEQYYIASQTGPYAVNAAADATNDADNSIEVNDNANDSAENDTADNNEDSISEHEEEDQPSEVAASNETQEEGNEAEHDPNESSGSTNNSNGEIESQVVPHENVLDQGEQSSESSTDDELSDHRQGTNSGGRGW